MENLMKLVEYAGLVLVPLGSAGVAVGLYVKSRIAKRQAERDQLSYTTKRLHEHLEDCNRHFTREDAERLAAVETTCNDTKETVADIRRILMERRSANEGGCG